MANKDRTQSIEEILIDEGDLDDSNVEDNIIEEKPSQVRIVTDTKALVQAKGIGRKSPDFRNKKAQRLNIQPDDVYLIGSTMANNSTEYTTGVQTSKSISFPKFLNKTTWAQTAKSFKTLERETKETHESQEETKIDISNTTHNTIRNSIARALGKDSGNNINNLKGKRISSTHRIPVETEMTTGQSLRTIKPARPQTTDENKAVKNSRILKSRESEKKLISKYELAEIPDIFDDSNDHTEEFEAIIESKMRLASIANAK